MKNMSRWLTLLLTMTLLLSLTACGSIEADTDDNEPRALTVGYDKFSGEFSPFFAQSISDSAAVSMVTLTLLNSDRAGAIVYRGIEGETRSYHGTDYTYYGPADLTLTENTDGSVSYDITLRDDLFFSDGEAITIDDLIFSMYVLCDPSYTGPSHLKECPIQGLQQYLRNQMSLSALLAQLGEENADFSYVTPEQQNAFWNAVNNGMTELAQQIFEAQRSIQSNNGTTDSFTVANAAAMCGITVEDNATLKEFALAIGAQYQWNFQAIDRWLTHSNMSGIPELSVLLGADVYEYSETVVNLGADVSYISGIQKTGDYSLRITATETDPTMLYELAAVPIAPLHYYGDQTLFDYDAHSFGFSKGNLETVKSETAQPLGAGPYQFVQYADNAISFAANSFYYLGTPKTKQIVFYEDLSADYSWKTESVLNGSLDICYSTCGLTPLILFIKENGGMLAGEKYQISLTASDSTSYTYLGMKPELMNIAGKPDSDASRSLRKAIGTLIAVYRDTAIQNYQREGWEISVLDAPISGASWVASEIDTPAFSVDANGTEIYTEGMTAEQRYDAAQSAALSWLERAGYIVENKKVVAAPEGGKLSYEVQINSFTGEMHYSEILYNAQKAFAELGIELKIRDLYEEEAANDFLPVEPGKSEMWVDFWTIPLQYSYENMDKICWSDSADPAAHLYDVYYSDAASNGTNAGRYANIYGLNDSVLDTLLLDAQSTADQNRRIALYRECLTRINDAACELPLYQDQNSTIFSMEHIKPDTIPTDLTVSYDWIREVYRIALL